MIKIRLNDDAYAQNGEHRYTTNEGKASAWVLRDTWYQGTGITDDGRTVNIFWSVCDDYDPESADESDACDWLAPAEVIDDDTGLPIDDYVIIF